MTGLVPGDGDERHGTYNGYNNLGCRCFYCRITHAKEQNRMRQNRFERLRLDPTLAPHGRASTYGNWGCRCAPCTDAWRLDIAAIKRRTKERKQRDNT